MIVKPLLPLWPRGSAWTAVAEFLGVGGHPPGGYTVRFQPARPRKLAPRNQLGMRFNLVDRIAEVVPGRLIRAWKNLTLGEEYLADHFPTFPVMPGVLMLQALVEAGAWLVRATDDFRHAVIVLREARNVKYGNFMEPGRSLVVTAEVAEMQEGKPEVTFKGKGEMEGVVAV